MLKRARTIHPGIHFRKGNILELEFEDNSIAGVVSFCAIVDFTKEQVRRVFREVFRVLQPGGLFLFTYYIAKDTIRSDEFLGRKVDIDFMFFTTGFVAACPGASGFEKREIMTISRLEYEGEEPMCAQKSRSCKKCPEWEGRTGMLLARVKTVIRP